MKISLLSSVFALAVAPAYAAEWYGTSLDAEGHAQWNDAANWDSTTGVPVGNINFTESVINGKSGSKTVYLDDAYTFWGNYHLYAGTVAAPLTFKASGSNGFAATENKEMYIGNGSDNPAYVVLDGGTYTFMNDVNLGWNQSAATLVINEGTRVQLPHWFKMSYGSGGGAESSLVVDGGELFCGWRNDAAANNARFSIAGGDGSKASVALNGGSIRAAGGSSADVHAFLVGYGARSHGAFTMTDGTLELTDGGRFEVAYGNTATGIVQVSKGTLTLASDISVAFGANSFGSMEFGGNATLGGWLYVGRGNNSDGYFHGTGGSLTAPAVRVGEGYNESDVKGRLVNDGCNITSTGDFRIASDATRPTGVMTNNAGNIVVGSNFAVGASNGGNGVYVHNGGTNTVAQWGYISRNGGTGYMEMNGGLMTFGQPLVVGSTGSAGRMKMTGGTISVPNSPLRLNVDTTAAVETYVLLEGGVLSCKRIETYNTGADAKAYVTLDGGTIAPNQAGQNFLVADDKVVVRVGAKGGTIDTGSIKVSGLNHEIVSALEEGETDGGLTFTGKGIAVQQGALKYSGTTFVQSGVLAITNGFAITGPVKIGRNGAIAVDITPARTAATDAGEDLAVDGKIALFSTSALSFEEATDDITTSVFLTGPVVGYTLSSETADGRTTVYATITDVANIAKSRKVTTFVTGTEFDDTLADPLLPHHVDQDAAYSNGQPANNSYDVVVFPSDAVMYIWSRYYKNRDEINNRCFGDLVMRGGTVSVVASNGTNARWPNLGVKHVAGNGTLCLARIGLNTQDHTSLVVDEHVNVEPSTQGIRTDIPATQDVWFGGTGTTTVNGDVFVTNGIMKVQPNVTFNGDVTIGYYQPLQSWLDVDGTVFNGDLILGDGATFNCNGKTATFGEDARLVLKGGTLANTNNITAWPKTVIQGGVYTYGAIPGAAEYTIEGGKLNVVPTTDDSGATITLTGVTLADGVNAEDVIQMAGTNFKWLYTVDETTGVITAEAYEALDSSVPNEWIGGAQGMWKQASNWTRGIPTIDQTVEFTYDAVCFYDKKQDIFGEVGKLVLNGHNVTVAAKNYDRQYWGGLRIASFDENETGILNLWKAGIWNNKSTVLEFPATMKLTITAPNSDCWIHEDFSYVHVRCPVEVAAGTTFNLDYRVHLYGGVSGGGTVTARQKSADVDNCRYIGGDWSGFTGTFNAHASDRTRFLADFTGGENSTWNFPQYFRFDHTSGTVKFGQLTIGADKHVEVVAGSTLTIETGALNGNPVINGGVCFYTNTASDWTGTWTQGSATATIKKVGTGTMSCGMVAAGNLDVAEGVCSLTGGDANVNVTVRDGATLQAANNATIGALTCEAGANIRLTTLESNPVITVDGTAVVDGANVTLADGLADTLYAQTDPASYTILNAGTISGTPAGKFACDEKNVFWLAKAASGTLKLARRLVMDGLFIIVH